MRFSFIILRYITYGYKISIVIKIYNYNYSLPTGRLIIRIYFNWGGIKWPYYFLSCPQVLGDINAF